MKLLSVELYEPVHWSVNPNDPLLTPLPCFSGWSLVNPILCESVWEALHPKSSEPRATVTYIYEGATIVRSRCLFLSADRDETIDESIDAVSAWDDNIFMLLKHLRYASKQITLSSPMLKSWGLKSLGAWPDCPRYGEGEKVATQRWHVGTAISQKHIEIAGRQNITEPPPAFDGMLLEAMSSLMRRDYKTAILLAAVSMENLARHSLAKAYDNAIANTNQGTLRIEFTSNEIEQNTACREELFDLLVESRRFIELLNESSLILCGRSLLRDNKQLYDKARKIYDRRNRIVHKGIMEEAETNKIAGIYQAIDAVECAIALIDWFGELGGYISPLQKTDGMTSCYLPVKLNQ